MPPKRRLYAQEMKKSRITGSPVNWMGQTSSASNSTKKLAPGMAPGASAPERTGSDVKRRGQGVRHDECLARWHVVAHQLGEQLIGSLDVVHLDLEEHAVGGIHRRFPELIGVHLTQSLVALHVWQPP